MRRQWNFWSAPVASVARARAGLLLSLAALSLLPSCSERPSPAGRPAAQISPAQAGLDAALRSGNADLIADTVIVALENQDLPGLEIDTLMRGIRQSPGGAAAVNSASQLLRRRLAAGPAAAATRSDDPFGGINSLSKGRLNTIPRTQLNRAQSLIALMALNPTGADKEQLLNALEDVPATESDPFGTLREAAAEAVFLAERNPAHWPAILRQADWHWRPYLLRVAVRRGLALPDVLNIPAIADALQAFVANGSDDVVENAGLALRLIDLAGAAPPPGAVSPTRSLVARAAAANLLRNGDEALNYLRRAATPPLDQVDRDAWLDVAQQVAITHPRHQPALRALAERLLPTGVAPTDRLLETLSNLRSPVLVEPALRRVRNVVGSESFAAGASEEFSYLQAVQAWQPTFEAFCSSPAGARQLPAPRSLGALLHSMLLPSLNSWSTFASDAPERPAAAFVGSTLIAQPERMSSYCIVSLIRGQPSGRTRVREAARVALAGRRDLGQRLEQIVAALRTRPGARPSGSERCDRFAETLQDPDARRRIEGNRLAAYKIACDRLPERGFRSHDAAMRIMSLSRLFDTPGGSAVIYAAAPYSIWGTTPNFPAAAVPVGGTESTDVHAGFAALIAGPVDRERLDYSALISPLLSGGNLLSPIDDDERHVGAARLLLALGDDPVLAPWVVARVRDYDGDRRETVAATFPLLRRAWADVGKAAQRRADADRLFETADEDSGQQLTRTWSALRRRIADEATAMLDRACPDRSGAGALGQVPLDVASFGDETCIGGDAAEARAFSSAVREAGYSAAAIDFRLSRESTGGIVGRILLVLALHLVAWTVLIFVYPHSPVIQASVFWNPWVRKYLGLGYVQLALLTLPPLTRRLLGPFRNGFTADAQLDSFRADFYFEDIRGRRPGDPPEGRRLAELLPSVDGKIWLEARSGSGKSWFLRELASRSRRPLVFLSATSCAAGIPAALAKRTSGWIAESTFLEQFIYSGRLVIIIDGLNEVAADIRSDIVAYADRFPRGRILIATQAVRTNPPTRAERVEVLPLGRDHVERFLLSRADEVLAPGDDRETFDRRVRAFMAELGQGTEEEKRALLDFVSNPMDLRLVADLLAKDIAPDLLNLQQQQIALVEREYEEVNGNPFPMADFAEFLYRARSDNKSLILADGEWQAEREALRTRRLVLRDDAPGGGQRWRFRHDKITDYFLYEAFKRHPDRFNEHLADNRFIGVYVLFARNLAQREAERMLRDLYWAGGRADDFTIGKAFQDALEQKIALQQAARSQLRGKTRRRRAG